MTSQMIKHSRVVKGKSYHSSSHFSIMQEMPPNDIGGKFLAHSFPSDNLLVLNNNFNDLKPINVTIQKIGKKDKSFNFKNLLIKLHPLYLRNNLNIMNNQQ